MATAGGNVIRLAFLLSLCFPANFALQNAAASRRSTILGSTRLTGVKDHPGWLLGLAEAAHSPGHAAHAHEDPADEDGEHVHHATKEEKESTYCVAVCLLSGILLSPMVLHMAISGGFLSYLTIRLADKSISIFIAIMWFEVFRQTIKTFRLREKYPVAVDVFGILQIFWLYTIAVFFIYCFRKDKIKMKAISTCSGHLIAFIGMAASRQIAKNIDESIENPWYVGLLLLSFTILLVVSVTLYAKLIDRAVTAAIQPSKELEEVDEVIDEMEMELEGLVASFLLTQCLRYGISGAAAMQEHSHVKHPAWARQFMLAWAIGITILLVATMPRLSRMVKHDRAAKKFVLFIETLLIMMCAWGYMLAAEWVFYEAFFSGDDMFAHLVFALLISIIGLSFLVPMAIFLEFQFTLLKGRNEIRATHLSEALQHITPRSRSEAVMHRAASTVADTLSADAAEALHEGFQKAALITVTGISFVIAWSWKRCFIIAFDNIGDYYSVGYGGLVPKLALAVAAPFLMLPTYVVHIKPRVVGVAKDFRFGPVSSASESMSDKEPLEQSVGQHDC